MALVQNIPIYDSVTKQGSHFKAELKAMTSATIVVLLFVLGALTYFTVKRDVNRPREEGNNLSERLLHNQQFSVLASEDGDAGDDDVDNESDLNSSTFEIEGRHHLSTPRSEVQRGL